LSDQHQQEPQSPEPVKLSKLEQPPWISQRLYITPR